MYIMLSLCASYILKLKCIVDNDHVSLKAYTYAAWLLLVIINSTTLYDIHINDTIITTNF